MKPSNLTKAERIGVGKSSVQTPTPPQSPSLDAVQTEELSSPSLQTESLQASIQSGNGSLTIGESADEIANGRVIRISTLAITLSWVVKVLARRGLAEVIRLQDSGAFAIRLLPVGKWKFDPKDCLQYEDSTNIP